MTAVHILLEKEERSYFTTGGVLNGKLVSVWCSPKQYYQTIDNTYLEQEQNDNNYKKMLPLPKTLPCPICKCCLLDSNQHELRDMSPIEKQQKGQRKNSSANADNFFFFFLKLMVRRMGRVISLVFY